MDESLKNQGWQENSSAERCFYKAWLQHSMDIIRTGLYLISVLSVVIILKYIEGIKDFIYSLLIIIIMLTPVGIGLFSVFYPVSFIRFYSVLIKIVMSLSCLGVPVTISGQQGVEMECLFSIMILFIFWIYGFSRLGLEQSSQWACMITIIYMTLLVRFNDIPDGIIAFDIAVIMIANIAGMTFSYDCEKQARLLFMKFQNKRTLI